MSAFKPGSIRLGVGTLEAAAAQGHCNQLTRGEGGGGWKRVCATECEPHGAANPSPGVSHPQWLVFLSLCSGDIKAYFTVCRKEEGFQNWDATEKAVSSNVFVNKKRKSLLQKSYGEISSPNY